MLKKNKMATKPLKKKFDIDEFLDNSVVIIGIIIFVLVFAGTLITPKTTNSYPVKSKEHQSQEENQSTIKVESEKLK